jgi:hypothetical protein
MRRWTGRLAVIHGFAVPALFLILAVPLRNHQSQADFSSLPTPRC